MEITLHSKTFRFRFSPPLGMSASFLRDNLLAISGVLGVSGLPDAFPPDVIIGEIPVYVSVAPNTIDEDIETGIDAAVELSTQAAQVSTIKLRIVDELRRIESTGADISEVLQALDGL